LSNHCYCGKAVSIKYYEWCVSVGGTLQATIEEKLNHITHTE